MLIINRNKRVLNKVWFYDKTDPFKLGDLDPHFEIWLQSDPMILPSIAGGVAGEITSGNIHDSPISHIKDIVHNYSRCTFNKIPNKVPWET